VASPHADAGQAMPAECVARAAVRYHKFETSTRQVSMRNTGTNTLWISFDRETWFDVAAGTSWDDRVTVAGFWYCTQLGMTAFVVNGLSLNHIDFKAAAPTDDELDG
jgi:hypothetical protein